MSAEPDVLAAFAALERRLEAEPEGITGEIARGVYCMSPRPRFRHGWVQVNLAMGLRLRAGKRGDPSAPPDWLFVSEPEIRSARNLSRLVPDVGAWRRSTTGWPDPDATLIELMPDWVGEVLSPSTRRFDREEKLPAYGAMGVGWVWLVDADAKSVETFVNVRGQMQAGPTFGPGGAIEAEPFGFGPIPLAEIFEP